MQGTRVVHPASPESPAAQSGAAPNARGPLLRLRPPAWLLGIAAVTVLSSPMLFTRRALGTDWTNHLWLVWNQGLQFGSLLHPSYFVHSDFLGIYYPHYAYYGGTMYAVTGGLSALLG